MATDFGTDVSGATDLTPTLLNISGLPMMQQVICRRLYTPPGSLLSSPSAITIDLRDYLSTTVNRDGSGNGFIRTSIVQALMDDPRIFSVTVDLSFEPDTGAMLVGLAGLCAAGPFALTLAVTSLTVELLRA